MDKKIFIPFVENSSLGTVLLQQQQHIIRSYDDPFFPAFGFCDEKLAGFEIDMLQLYVSALVWP